MEMTRRGLFGMVAGAVAGRRSIALGGLKLEEQPVKTTSFSGTAHADGSVTVHLDGRELAQQVIKHLPQELYFMGLGK